jgi:outer membrane protein TolC
MDKPQPSYSTPHVARKPLSVAFDGLRRVPQRAMMGFLVTLSLAGCAVGPDFKAPTPPADRGYMQQEVSASSAGIGQRVLMGETLHRDWWTSLQSPELNELVEQALANNWSLEIARANLAKAEETVAVARGGLFPKIDAVAGAGRQKYGATFLGPEAATFPVFSAYTGGAAVSYDFDVFGGQRRPIELAAADTQVQEEALNAAHLSVAGDTVLAALQIASIRAQIEAVQSVIHRAEQTDETEYSCE